MQTDLYRHFDAQGNLLYVGISLSTVQRLIAHKVSSKWFEQIVKITIERFATRAEAIAAEENAILSEKPAFNSQFSIEKMGKRHGTMRKAEIIRRFGSVEDCPIASMANGRWLRSQIDAFDGAA